MPKLKSLTDVGEEVYRNNRDWLEREHMGKVVALCEKGVAGIGEDILEVYEKAKQKHKGPFYFRRVGPNPAVGYLLVFKWSS